MPLNDGSDVTMKANKYLTVTEFITVLDAHIEDMGGGSLWAAHHGVSPGFISQIRNSRKPIPQWVAEVVGYRPVIFYERNKNAKA